MLSAVLALASGATACHSSSVMNGIIGCSRRNAASSTRTKVRRVVRRVVGAAGLDLHFGQFDIPVAIVVPHEFVQRLRDQVEAVGFKCFGGGGFGLLQAADNPLVGEGVGQRLGFVLAAVLVFGVHQDEVGGVPDFVAEVAVAFGAFKVEVYAAPQAGVARHGEAQCVRAHTEDTFGEEFFRGFFHFQRGFGFTQTGRTFHQ